MRQRTTLFVLPAFLFLAAAVASTCADPDDDDMMGDDDDDDGWECDPVGANPEMGMLLNEPLDPAVQVVQKVPQHPGNPGPLNLP